MKYFCTLKNIFIAFATVVLMTACSHAKEISYFQDYDKYQQGQAQVQTPNNYQVKIHPDDELMIIVSTALNPEAAAPFNLSAVITQGNSNVQGVESKSEQGESSSKKVSSSPSYQSYLVDGQGDIVIPSLGKMAVSGLTLEEAKSEIESRLKAYIKDPIVTIRLLSFRISVLGEVNSPGVQNYDRQKVTILDAIAQAKDLTIYARRDEIRLIRDDNGKKEYYVYDLTKSDFMSSPYYYLKPNDIIYVVPNKERQGDAKISKERQYNISLSMSIASITLGVISTIATIYAITN